MKVGHEKKYRTQSQRKMRKKIILRELQERPSVDLIAGFQTAHLSMNDLRTFAPETPGEREILGLNSNTLSVNSGQISVLKKRDKVGLCGFLKSHHS